MRINLITIIVIVMFNKYVYSQFSISDLSIFREDTVYYSEKRQ